DMCPIVTLYFFTQKTNEIRNTLPAVHILILTYLEHENQLPRSHHQRSLMV
ncbi:uncharacterized protein BYT42DRAFT_496247, partial [Radiomyces spectabilis]|uniref:uncharacterized protein n=1 Tax=Radiomyces spectabilis TaxID=64574 RepID=UPI00221FA92A